MLAVIALEHTEELIRDCKEQTTLTQECCRISNMKLLRCFCVYPVAEVPLVSQQLVVANAIAFLKGRNLWAVIEVPIRWVSTCASCIASHGLKRSWGPQTSGFDLRAWSSAMKSKKTEGAAKRSCLQKSEQGLCRGKPCLVRLLGLGGQHEP